jgi:hypothetical protein
MQYVLTLPYDGTGTTSNNSVLDVIETAGVAPSLYTPNKGAFYQQGAQLLYVDDAGVHELQYGTDWYAVQLNQKQTLELGLGVYEAITVNSGNYPAGIFYLFYQAVGDATRGDFQALQWALDDYAQPKPIDWANLDHPLEFVPTPGHLHDAKDLYGLEYLTQPLSRLAASYAAEDKGAGKQVIGYHLDAKKDELWAAAADGLSTSAEQIASSTLLSDEQNLQITNQDKLNRAVLDQITTKINSVTQLINTYARDRAGALKAYTLIELLEKRSYYDLSILEVPLHIAGLVSWIDFTTALPSVPTGLVTLNVIDKANTARVFTGANMRVAKSRRLQRMCAVFDANKRLTITSGTAVRLGSNHTVLVVTSNDLTGNTPERLSVLSNDVNERISVDYPNGVALQQKSAYGGWSMPAIMRDNLRAHIGYASVSSGAGMSYSASNAVSGLKGPTKYFSDSVALLSQPVDYGVIGGNDQNGAIAEILIYDRQLSRYELVALNAYLFNKYGLSINLIANGGFSEGLTGFSTDYQPRIKASIAGSICVLRKPQIFLDPNQYTQLFVIPNLQLIQKQMENDNTILMVNTSTNSTLAFWRTTVNVQFQVTYRLSVSLLYNPSVAPSIKLKANGVDCGLGIGMDVSNARSDGVTWWITANSDTLVLELFNMNTATGLNTFALDNVSLVQDSQSMRSTFTTVTPE